MKDDCLRFVESSLEVIRDAIHALQVDEDDLTRSVCPESRISPESKSFSGATRHLASLKGSKETSLLTHGLRQ